MNRPAFLIASAGSASYDMNGISTITVDRLTARVTALVIISISSMVTGIVVSYPKVVIPPESPTRIRSIPARSTSSAIG